MAITTTAPIENGIVRLVRSRPTLKAALKGGIHNRVASRRVKYPYMVYSMVTAPVAYDWGNASNGGTATIHALYDLTVFAITQVEAKNLDWQLANLFGGLTADLDLNGYVEGQQVILCRRTAETPTGPDRDDEGRYIVQVGGTYEIWTTQPFIEPVMEPAPTP